MSKKIIRKKLLNKRKKKFKSAGINFLLLKKTLNKFKNIKKIGAYYPINYEIDCFETLRKLEKNGYKISLPITKSKNKIDFHEWSFDDKLNIGQMGIPEPCNRKKVYPDIILVPMVAFDKHKYRLGYGGGYYDRYIDKISKLKKIITIGMAFSFQEVNNLPINKYDKKLDFIITEKNIN